MPVIILISGAGQLGSRYLQGMSQCEKHLKIYVHDFNEEALLKARQRWDEVSNSNNHEVLYITSLELLPKNIDIAIVATTASVRLSATSNICNCTKVKYWVLEKVLAQNEHEIDQILSLIDSSKAWVNTPRRLMSWHQNIKNNLDWDSPVNFLVKGGSWGLACNAIHFLDLFSWWSGESLKSVNTENLNKDWFKSKRAYYWEVLGELKVEFSNGSKATIYADQSSEPVLIKVENNYSESTNYSWLINEAEGMALRSDGAEISGNMNFQSEITAPMIDSIIDNGFCDLPLLKDSAELHRVFIREMHRHWKKSGNPAATFVPIT
jgi:hypothetical protein